MAAADRQIAGISGPSPQERDPEQFFIHHKIERDRNSIAQNNDVGRAGMIGGKYIIGLPIDIIRTFDRDLYPAEPQQHPAPALFAMPADLFAIFIYQTQ